MARIYRKNRGPDLRAAQGRLLELQAKEQSLQELHKLRRLELSKRASGLSLDQWIQVYTSDDVMQATKYQLIDVSNQIVEVQELIEELEKPYPKNNKEQDQDNDLFDFGDK